jgi:hypothetical protein
MINAFLLIANVFKLLLFVRSKDIRRPLSF